MRQVNALWGNVKYSGGESAATITQAAHGLTVGCAIRHNETIFVKAQADSSENAQTCGIVTKVVDVDTFQYQSEGFLIDAAFEAGKEYFLSPVTAGLVMELPTPEVWTVGQVRQSLGFGTPQGLKIEIDVGDEIGEAAMTSNVVTSLVIAGGNLTLIQSEGDDVFVPFPYYTKTELNTSGAGGAVHWNNVTNKPTYDNYNQWRVTSYSNAYNNFSFSMKSDYVLNFSETDAIDVYLTGFSAGFIKIYHKDTSDQANSVNTGTTVIQSVELDDYGHVTALATKTIDEYQGWNLALNDTIFNSVVSGRTVNFIEGTDISIGMELGSPDFQKNITISYTGGNGVTDHGALSGLLDYDHPQYAKLHGEYSEYFQVADLRIGAATGWKLIDNGTVLELQYNGVKKFEFKTNGEAFGTDFIAY